MIVKHKYIAAKHKKQGRTWKQANKAAVGTAMAHMKYIQHRPGEDKEKGGREFFDAENSQSDQKAFKQKIKEMGSRGAIIHKLTLAPDVDPVDAQAFTREVMDKIEKEKGLNFQWQAVVHRNTDNHHVHVVVLGKDKNGADVRFEKKDYALMKHYGDKYLDREQPVARMEKRREYLNKLREKDELERVQKELERQGRIERGEELPWIKQKLLREQLEPYEQWKQNQPKDKEDKRKRFVYLEKEYSENSSLKELQEASRLARENKYDDDRRMDAKDKRLLYDWIEDKDRARFAGALEKEMRRQDYLQRKREGKLEASETVEPLPWIKKKIIREQLEPYAEWKRRQLEDEATKVQLEPDSENKDKEPEAKDTREKFEYLGKEYRKDSKLEDLFRASKVARENKYSDEKRMDDKDKSLLNNWIENQDRERFSGILEKEMGKAIRRQEREEQQQAQGQRWVDPDSEHLLGNPVVGVILTAHAFAKSVVDDIPTDWSKRDELKDRWDAANDRLQDAKAEADPVGKESEKVERAIKDLNIAKIEAEKAIEKRREKKFQEKLKQKEERERQIREDW